jgi:hypothetical protein
MRKFLLVLPLMFLAAPALAADPVPVVAADHAEAPGSGAGSAAATPSPSASVPDPAEHPIQAWDEAKAAKKGGWAMLVFFVLVALTKALAYGREKLAGVPLVGKASAWLAQGKRAMIVAGATAIGVAGYDVLAGGGSLTAALFAAGAALAGVLHSETKGA